MASWPAMARSRSPATLVQSMTPSGGGATRNSLAAMPCSSEWAWAPSTSSPWIDRTPATRLKRPGRSGATVVTRSPSASTAVRRSAMISVTSSEGNSDHVASLSSPPPSTWATRSTSSSTSSAFHEPHADGPVAIESASVSAASSSSTSWLADGRRRRR